MTAVLLKIASVFMSVIVFLSGTFPGLFGGKEYINPYGDSVTVIDSFNIEDEPVVIGDYETFVSLGIPGVDYSEDFFESNSLAVFSSIQMEENDEFYIVSICVDGKNMELKYYIREYEGLTIQLYMPVYKTVLIETTKEVTMLRAVEADKSRNPIRPK